VHPQYREAFFQEAPLARRIRETALAQNPCAILVMADKDRENPRKISVSRE